MKKIFSGILGIILTTGLVGGVAYAQLVSPTASVQGVTFTAGNADLKVWNGTVYDTVYNVSWNFNNMYPGFVATPTTFWLKNTSSAPIALQIKGNLRAGAAGDWDALKNYILVAIHEVGDISVPMEFHTLEDWFSTGVNFIGTGAVLAAPGSEKQYEFHVKVDPLAVGIENKSLTSVNFDFVGTQTP